MMAGDQKTIVECRCGRCGRVIGVSDGELRAHGGVVVCPVCLNHIVVDGYESAAALEKPATATAFRYCFNCGEALPRDLKITYCPYCGVRQVPDEEQKQTRTGYMQNDTLTASDAPSGERERPVPTAAESERIPEPEVTSSFFLPGSLIPAWMDGEPNKPASLRFHIFAGIIIAVLLVALGMIFNAIAALP